MPEEAEHECAFCEAPLDDPDRAFCSDWCLRAWEDEALEAEVNDSND